MSFLIDRYKADFFSKKFTVSTGIPYTQTNSVEQFENSTTFKKFATVVPRLDGKITGITVNLKTIYSAGAKKNIISVQERDSNGNVLEEISAQGGSSVTFHGNPSVSAFEKIELYFKNVYDIPGQYTTNVPKSITLYYHVQENPDYFFVKSE